MTFRLTSAPAPRRNRARLAGAVLLAALVLPCIAAVGRAEEADPFTAQVAADATADTVAKAREMARLDGQRRALTMVADRLAGGAAAKLQRLDDNALTGLVASFEVANERMSAVRYAADFTFHFRPEETRRVLRITGAAATDDTGRPLVVVPLYQSGGQARLWDDTNPWRQAWEQQPPAAGQLKLLVPLGDAGDIAAIDAEKARAADPEALAAIARRNGGEEAIVATAVLRGPADQPSGVDVTVRRYRGGRPVDSHAEPLAANPGESENGLLRRAAAAVAADIGSGWKNASAQSYDQQGSLTAVLPITSLDDWVAARDRLLTVPTIRKVALTALSVQEATIEIGYVGSIDQLKTSLAEISLDLVRGEPAWRLARIASPRTP